MAERDISGSPRKKKHTGALVGLRPDEIEAAPGARVIRIEYVSLDDLADHRAAKNAKKHRLDQIDASMRRHGYTAPIMIDEGTQSIVAGHGRIDTLVERKLAGREPPDGVIVRDGTWLVPVVRGISFKDPVEAMSYLMADNRIQELAGYDWNETREIAALVEQSAEGLDGTGFASLEEIAAQADREVNEILSSHGDDDTRDEQRLPDDDDDNGVLDASGESQHSLPHIRFGPHRIRMTDEEASVFGERLKSHADKFGTLHGFGGFIVRALESSEK
jgi:hypothetical protein